jgi:hypothetical protein
MSTMKLQPSGKTFKSDQGLRYRWDYSETFYIQTRELKKGGATCLERQIYLGDLSIDGDEWDWSKSTLNFMGKFYLEPYGKKIIPSEDGDRYSYTLLEVENVEWGRFYSIKDYARPYYLSDLNYETERVQLFEYSAFGKFQNAQNVSYGLDDDLLTEDRSILEEFNLSEYLPLNWWIQPFKKDSNGNQTDKKSDISSDTQEIDLITLPETFNKKLVDKIINFNPTNDSLEIDTDSFGIDSSATFAAGKNKREVKKLAKQDFDFLFDEKKGGLYFNENGSDKGFGDGGIIAILKGAPDLTMDNIDLV